MTTRCKVRCSGTTESISPDYSQPVDKTTNKYPDIEIQTASFVPVVDSSEENKKFFAATPAFNLTLGVIRGRLFEADKTYYVDFTEAD